MEAFRPIRDTIEDVADKVDNISERIKDIKDQRMIEQLKAVEGKWEHGPLHVRLEPAYYSTTGIDTRKLASPEKFEEAYPELASILDSKAFVRPSPIILGRMDISSFRTGRDGNIERYAVDGRSVIMGGAELFKDLKEALAQMALKMRDKKDPLSTIDYVVGLSRLGSVAGHLGFDTYPLSNEVTREHESHILAENALMRQGMDEDRAHAQARKRPATLAVMPKERFLELFGPA